MPTWSRWSIGKLQQHEFLHHFDVIRKTLEEMEKSAAELKKKKIEVLKEEKSQPLNVDTLSKVSIMAFTQLESRWYC